MRTPGLAFASDQSTGSMHAGRGPSVPASIFTADLRSLPKSSLRAGAPPAARRLGTIPNYPNAPRRTHCLMLKRRFRDPHNWTTARAHLENSRQRRRYSATAAPFLAPASTSVNFFGMSNRNGANPPDTNGDIGLNDYVEYVNTSVQVFDRSGTSLAGPFDVSDLFQTLPSDSPCKQSADHHSDGVVRYDAIADRWVITTVIATPSGLAPTDECFAVSRSSDPVSGGWHTYDFRTSTHRFGDYPKLSLWPDGYYMTVNWFLPNNTPAGTGVFAFNRSAMLSGGNSAFQCVHCDADNFAGPLEQEQGMLFADSTVRSRHRRVRQPISSG